MNLDNIENNMTIDDYDDKNQSKLNNNSDTENSNYATNLLNNLNTEQQKAVECLDKHLLVLAGAGTGKTSVLTARVANIIQQQKCYPSEILVVTFTNKAANEIKERISKILNQNVNGLWIGTFHSICVRILRPHAHFVGLDSNFKIIDTVDQKAIIKQIYKDKKLDDKSYKPEKTLSIISKWKDKCLTPEQVTANDVPDHIPIDVLSIYREYQKRLQTLNAVDFDDLLLHVVKIFQQQSEILSIYSSKFKYILIDEYQDTNISQYKWLKLLAKGNNNICCVGDDDQSIYGWRGAEVGNILKFEKDFKDVKVIKLGQNYRSTSYILDAASQLIANNSSRYPKKLWTSDSNTAENKIEVISCCDDIDEANTIANIINKYSRNYNIPYSNNVILVRSSFQTRIIEESLVKNKVPYKIIGGLRFYDRKELKDLISYIRLAFDHKDDLALQRIINVPQRGVGKATYQKIYETAINNRISLLQAIELMISENKLSKNITEKITPFINNLKQWKKLLDDENLSLMNSVKTIFEESGYEELLLKDEDAKSRLENIKEFFNALADFNNVEEFLEHISLIHDIEIEQDDSNENPDEAPVLIMTLHNSKGLEFENVFLPGWEEGLFPSARSINENEKGLEEERRLAYVGITRSKCNLHILYANRRKMFFEYRESPKSRFINEIEGEHIEYQQNKGFFKSIPNNSHRNMIRNKIYSSNNKMKLNNFIQTNNNNNKNNSSNNSTNSHSNNQNNNANKSDNITNSNQKYSHSNFVIGDKINHIKFQDGTITSILGDIVEVEFDQYGKRIVMYKDITEKS